MYDKELRSLEERLKYGLERLFSDEVTQIGGEDIVREEVSKLADLIIKIKTIQALDTSAELIAASRRVSRN